MSAWLELFRLVGGGAQMRPANVYRDDCSHRHNYTVGKQLTQLKQTSRTGLLQSRDFSTRIIRRANDTAAKAKLNSRVDNPPC